VKLAKRIRLSAEARREMIVAAAFQALANEGFEGLRTRDIAIAVKINSATLHHHFPTKEDLIAGVTEELARRFKTEKAPRAREPATAAAALADQFADVAYYAAQRPEMLAVYREFVGRSPRDPAIAALVERLHADWRSGLVEIFKAGRRDGSLRDDLAPEAAADLVLAAIWGFVALASSEAIDLKRASRELLRWLSPG
jgi:AcrR family transcriptional regulator